MIFFLTQKCTKDWIFILRFLDQTKNSTEIVVEPPVITVKKRAGKNPTAVAIGVTVAVCIALGAWGGIIYYRRKKRRGGYRPEIFELQENDQNVITLAHAVLSGETDEEEDVIFEQRSFL